MNKIGYLLGKVLILLNPSIIITRFKLKNPRFQIKVMKYLASKTTKTLLYNLRLKVTSEEVGPSILTRRICLLTLTSTVLPIQSRKSLAMFFSKTLFTSFRNKMIKSWKGITVISRAVDPKKLKTIYVWVYCLIFWKIRKKLIIRVLKIFWWIEIPNKMNRTWVILLMILEHLKTLNLKTVVKFLFPIHRWTI